MYYSALIFLTDFSASIIIPTFRVVVIYSLLVYAWEHTARVLKELQYVRVCYSVFVELEECECVFVT